MCASSTVIIQTSSRPSAAVEQTALGGKHGTGCSTDGAGRQTWHRLFYAGAASVIALSSHAAVEQTALGANLTLAVLRRCGSFVAIS